jgi:hypothetical protein
MSLLTDLLKPVLQPRAITGLTGGGLANLDGIPTVGFTTTPNTLAMFVFSDMVVAYRLRAGTDAESSPAIIRPDDYAGGANEKVWEKMAVGSATTFSNLDNDASFSIGGAVGVITMSKTTGIFQVTVDTITIGDGAGNAGALSLIDVAGVNSCDITIGANIILSSTVPFSFQCGVGGGFDFDQKLNTSVAYHVGGIKVVGSRVNGWAAATGTKLSTTFVTDTETLPNVAARLGAVIDVLIAHGLIGA